MRRSETGEVYKGVPIQNHQPRERIERRVKPQIDHVLALTDVSALINMPATSAARLRRDSWQPRNWKRFSV